MSHDKRGSTAAFDKAWRARPELRYVHWTRDEPKNQIQFAFRNNWNVFREILLSEGINKGARALEVGSGRGSMSCYFADAGYRTTLVDTSFRALQEAQSIFDHLNLDMAPAVGDACCLPFADQTFDVVFSIGLLEHFEAPDVPIREQARILRDGGIFLGYIVPDHVPAIQASFEWVNDLLKGYGPSPESVDKPAIYRTSYDSSVYRDACAEAGLASISVDGVYPLPMLSHSCSFPFSLMPPASEEAFVSHWREELSRRWEESGTNPWLCDEGNGQAFLVAARKPHGK